jgi:Sec-independent protein secretion pathway component TatC
MSQTDPQRPQQLDDLLQSLRRRLRNLTVAVILMTLMLILTVASVFGYLVDYHGGEAALFGGATVGAALLGFAFGWVARRKA